MKIAVIFPTIEEGKLFILSRGELPVFISGVGMVATSVGIIKAIKAKKPKFIILAGIAGAYDRSLNIGDVVEVTQERVSQLPEKYIEIYKNEPATHLPYVTSNTVTCSVESANGAQIENMEGATLFAMCKALDVECCQIRAISNYVGDPFEEWNIDLAVENLTNTLQELLTAMAEEDKKDKKEL